MRLDWSILHRLIFIPVKFNMASKLIKEMMPSCISVFRCDKNKLRGLHFRINITAFKNSRPMGVFLSVLKAESNQNVFSIYLFGH